MSKDQITTIDIKQEAPIHPEHKQVITTQKNNIIQLFTLWWKIITETTKQWWQRLYEHLPYAQIIDLYLEKWLVSRTPIPKRSLWYNGRIARTIPQSWIVSEAILNGKEIISDAKMQLFSLLDGSLNFGNIDADTWIVLASMLLGTMIYYWMIKRWDIQQIKKRRSQENNIAT